MRYLRRKQVARLGKYLNFDQKNFTMSYMRDVYKNSFK